MITDAQYIAWLRTDARKVLLVELEYYDPIAASAGTLYISDKGYNTNWSAGVEHRVYADDVVKIPSVRRSLDARPARGELVVDNTGGKHDDWLTSYKFDGRTVRMLYGSPDWEYADFRVVFAGITSDRTARGTKELVFRLRDPEDYLDVPLQNNTIATGPNAGEFEPVAYGECYNVPAILLDGATHQYQISDIGIASITVVKDEGKGPVAHTPDLANGKFTLTGTPVGNITVDFVGAKVGATTLKKAGEIINHIITERTDLPVGMYDAAAFTALDAAVAWEHNLFSKDRMTARQAIDMILASINARLSRTPEGLLTVVRIDEPALTADETVDLDDYVLNSLEPIRVELPWPRVRIGYRKNYFVQESLDTTLTEADRAALAREYQVAVGTNAISTLHPLASEPELIETTLTLQADAEALRDELLALHGVERFWFKLKAYAVMFQYGLGSTVTLVNDRFGLSAGENFLVWETDCDITHGRVEVILWR